MTAQLEIDLALSRAKTGLFYYAEQLLNIRSALHFLEGPKSTGPICEELMRDVCNMPMGEEADSRATSYIVPLPPLTPSPPPKRKVTKRKKKNTKKPTSESGLSPPQPSTWAPSLDTGAPTLAVEEDLTRDMPLLPDWQPPQTDVTRSGWEELLRQQEGQNPPLNH